MLLRLILSLLLGGTALLAAARLLTGLATLGLVHTPESVPARSAAVVFGAGLYRDGSPSHVLRDRVQTAAALYFSGKVQVLLMSGDNSTVYYNEPAAMRTFALALGVPPEAIVLDYAGRRTYDTCYRARDIFQLEQVILVTQGFHMPRALYTCNGLGVDAVGVVAQNETYRRSALTYWNLRELGATLGALWDLHVSRPVPILGRPEPIFPRAQ